MLKPTESRDYCCKTPMQYSLMKRKSPTNLGIPNTWHPSAPSVPLLAAASSSPHINQRPHTYHYHNKYRVIKKVSVHLTIILQTQCIRTIPTKLMSWRWPSQNTFGMWTALYWSRSSRTQFAVSINVWILAGNTLNITCNFLCCNYQVHRDFLITMTNLVL